MFFRVLVVLAAMLLPAHGYAEQHPVQVSTRAAKMYAQPVGGGAFGWQAAFFLNNDGTFILDPAAADQRSIFDFLPQSDVADITNNRNVDHGASLQAAVTAAGAGNLYFPDGTYFSSQTLLPANGQNWICGGKSLGATGARLAVSGALNAPLVDFESSSGGIKGCTLIGNAGAGQISQHLVMINNSSHITLDDNYYVNGYDAVYISGTSFYISLVNSFFGAQYHRHLNVNGGIPGPGVDLIMSNNRFLSLPSTADYSIYLDGLGSLIASNIQISANLPTSAAWFFNRPAVDSSNNLLFGGAQISNSVVEGGSGVAAAMVIGNPSGHFWNNILIENSLLTGGAGPALQCINSVRTHVTGGVLSSINTNGTFWMPPSSRCTDFKLIGVAFDNDSGATQPIQANAGAVISGDVISPSWGGSAPLFNASTDTAANIAYLNILAGNMGSHATPIVLPAGTIPGTRPGTAVQ
jgi:hypothetical protein